MKKTTLLRFAFLLATAFSISISGCKKDSSSDTANPVPINNDLITRTPSSVSGFVTDENNQPVTGASVTAGAKTTTTDNFGFFSISNADQLKNASFVTVTKTGYFKGIKTWIGNSSQPAFFRIKLLPKTTAGTVSGSTGGTVTLTGGMKIVFPASAFVNASTNAAYAGTVTVKAKWLDPTAADINSIMPGDLRGKNAAGILQALTTYGMSAVELNGSAGELLQIAPGKKASLTVAIPASLQGTAPATIPLWYFDETLGLWTEEGTATKAGTEYTGDVSHFSFWNYDAPANYIIADLTVNDAGGNPVSGALVKMTILSNGYYSYGYTNASGFISGAIPNNEQMKVEVVASWGCSVNLFSQNFNTGTTNISLGTVTLNSNRTIRLAGRLLNCNNVPVTNGMVYIGYDNLTVGVPVNAQGNYSVSFPICGSSFANTTIVGIDYTTLIQGIPVSNAYPGGSNNTLDVTACGTTSASTFMTYNYGSTATANYAPMLDTVGIYYTPGNNTWALYGTKLNNLRTTNITFQASSSILTVGQSYSAVYVNDSQTTIAGATTSNVSVTITEFGAPVTGFIAGTYTGTVQTGSSGNISVSGAFRVRRP